MRASIIITTVLSALTSSVAAACSCKKVSNEGLYCGYCTEVLTLGSGGLYNAYWCNKKGGCDDLGYSKTYCDKSTKIYCDGRDAWNKPGTKREEEAENVVKVAFEG
ncbi:hypothetical protein EJ07DRAFT_158627 [Lizonia empirigonia]|nr:hypothetical protein EJ07DRAFT_158627 [Lizonia empirigonia]